MRDPFHVGDWLVEPRLNQLRLEDREIRIEPRSMEVLLVLARAPGELQTKKEILDAVWGEQAISEEALTHAVWELRKALGDNARKPTYIQTIPKRGYRLIAPTSAPPGSEPEAAPPTGSGAVDRPPTPSKEAAGSEPVPPRAPLPYLLLAATLLVVFLGAIGINQLLRESNDPKVMVRALWRDSASDPAGLIEIESSLRSSLRGLRPIAPISADSTHRFRDASIERLATREVADYVLDLRLVREPGGSEIRVHLELVDVASDLSIDDWDTRVGHLDLVRPRSRAWLLEVAKSLQRERPDLAINVDAYELFLGLTGERSSVARATRPSTDSDAIRNALDRGLESAPRLAEYDEESLLEALELFVFVVEKDPTMAEAWVQIPKIEALLSYNGVDVSYLTEGLPDALARARQLGIDETELRLAEAYVAYYGRQDYAAARDLLEALARELPGDSEIATMLAFLQRRQGELEPAIETLQALEIASGSDPHLLQAIAQTRAAQRRFGEAIELYRQALVHDPSGTTARTELASAVFAETGSPAEALAILDEHPHQDEPVLALFRLRFLLFDRRYQEVGAEMARQPPPERPIHRFLGSWSAILAYEQLGQKEEARSLADEMRQLLEEQVAKKPGFAYFRAYLALMYAYLGQEREARLQVDEALDRIAGDSYSGLRIDVYRARVLALLGEPELAAEILAKALEKPYQHCLTRHELAADPFWDRWRADPGFARLVSARVPVTAGP